MRGFVLFDLELSLKGSVLEVIPLGSTDLCLKLMFSNILQKHYY